MASRTALRNGMRRGLTEGHTPRLKTLSSEFVTAISRLEPPLPVPTPELPRFRVGCPVPAPGGGGDHQRAEILGGCLNGI